MANSERKAKFDRLDAEMQGAIDKVKAIVNQPVTAVRRTPQMQISVFSPGWVHQGALKPDFSHVDVRQTQDTSSYSKFPLVTSDLNPGIAFLGSQLEFNSMTKYFYVNRSLPKKRLTEAEMLEINRLYRIIGKCEPEEQALAQTEETEPAPEKETTEKWVLKPIPRQRYIIAGIGIILVLGLYLLIRKSR